MNSRVKRATNKLHKFIKLFTN